MVKSCGTCKIEKLVTEFHRSYGKPRGYQASCKACKKEEIKKYKQYRTLMDPIYNRRSTLKRRYKLTIDQYNQLLSKQSNVCAICGGIDPKNGKNNLCVDHCHKTGKIRGLLCGPCNRALGCFYDNIENLNKAINYLECK